MQHVLLLATVETKSEEVGYLHDILKNRGLTVELIDISLGSAGATWEAARKLTQMDVVARQVSTRIMQDHLAKTSVVLGLGGGTGGEIILKILRELPFDLPKILITTLPFDPRVAVADNSIVLIPTLADIEGLNSSLRQVLENSANMLVGLARSTKAPIAIRKSIGLTSLGINRLGARKIISLLRSAGHETTSFHANGYGGAAFTRFAESGAFHGVIDMTVHEITRIHVAGAHVAMPKRFTATGTLPRIVMPGGLNFIGLGEIDLVPPKYLQRPHYQHSGYFTHVKLAADEMELVSNTLADALNEASGNTLVVLPMGGFSHEDCPGGTIEDKELRNIAAECLEARAKRYKVVRLPSHINDDDTSVYAVDKLTTLLSEVVTDD